MIHHLILTKIKLNFVWIIHHLNEAPLAIPPMIHLKVKTPKVTTKQPN